MVLWHFFFSPGPPPLTGPPDRGGATCTEQRPPELRVSRHGAPLSVGWLGFGWLWFGLGLAGFCSGSGLDFGLIFGWISASGFHVLGFWLDFRLDFGLDFGSDFVFSFTRISV